MTWTPLSIHEAGHAVACIVVGVDYFEAELNDEGGLVRHSGAKTVEDAAVITLAGPIAGVRVGETMNPLSMRHDGQKLKAYALELTGNTEAHEDNNPILRSLVDRAESIVSTHWDGIERIGAALVERRFLMDDDLREIGGFTTQ